ncbi:hypothetical protein HDV00_012452 [Rhizophlyctis rosea]|nr:hypothetical protein HDV00_012452 [Rhizophlyctis rosea]
MLAALSSASAAGVAEWKQRTVYQVMTDRFSRTDGVTANCENLSTYCGGSWKGIESRLDYLKDLGVDAIWISPILKNTEGGYHGFWTKNFEALNEKFGTEQDLVDMIAAAQARDIWVMLDIVLNHVGPGPISQISPTLFNSPYSYHEQCVISDAPETQPRLEQCRLGSGDGSLPDLNTEDNLVVQYLTDWTKNIVSKYKFNGLRLDAAKHIRKDFWPGVLQAADTFAVGEAYDARADYVAGYQQIIPSMQHYPFYAVIQETFVRGRRFADLEANRTLFQRTFPDHKAMLTFVENHDTTRFLNTPVAEELPSGTTGDTILYKNALTFLLLTDGIPSIFYGAEAVLSSPYNLDAHYSRNSLWQSKYDQDSNMYRWLRLVNSVRKSGGEDFFNANHTTLYMTDNVYAFQKGDAIAIINNVGLKLKQTDIYFNTNHAEGTVLTHLQTYYQTPRTSNDSLAAPITVGRNGAIQVTIQYGDPIVLFPQSKFQPPANTTMVLSPQLGGKLSSASGKNVPAQYMAAVLCLVALVVGVL